MSETEDDKDGDSSPPLKESGEAQIFLCDPSAEAGRLLNALQSRGFHIVDVPLGLLPNRTRYELPRLIICDADAHEAYLRLTEALEECPENVLVLLVGLRDGALGKNKKLASLATTCVYRPLDIDATARKIAELVGAPTKKRSHRPRLARAARAPSLVTAARKPYRSDAKKGALKASLPPSMSASSEPGLLDSSAHQFARVDAAFPRDTRPPFASTFPKSSSLPLSAETAAVLEEGRRRVESYPEQAPRPVRLPLMLGAGQEAVRSDYLEALSEPLDDSADESVDDMSRAEAPPPSGEGRTVAGTRETHVVLQEADALSTRHGHNERPRSEDERTNPGGRPMSQPPLSRTPTGFDSVVPLPLDDLSDLLTTSDRPISQDPILGATSPRRRNQSAPAVPSGRAFQDLAPGLSSRFEAPSSPSHPALAPNADYHREGVNSPTDQETVAPPFRHSAKHASDSTAPHPLLGVLKTQKDPDVPILVRLGQAIAERATGAVAQQEAHGVRRIVLTDGDITTVSSSIEGESLAHFLVLRGDFSEEVLLGLGAIPLFGRHAGAALIARGFVQQEELWPVLRAHAEWVLSAALRSRGPCHLEAQVPSRLQEEPAVFGGAAGTEIFVEAVRRILSPEQAFVALGKGERLLGIGPHEALLRESALNGDEQSQVLDVVGKPLKVIFEAHPTLLPVLYALVLLQVLTAGAGVVERNALLQEQSREIDDDAFRKRVLARRALVEDGDYFTILGLSRSATQHEVLRAHQMLMQQYSPERLTVRLLHLKDDLELVRSTINEAHRVLSDDVRRHRYRLALEAVPG